MTKKQFWQSASNWGLICGGALFVTSIIAWLLKLEQNQTGWPVELMHFAVICSLVLYTGYRNARLAGPEGYPYGRAVGYIFAMLMFAGIVYGVGRFLLVNFIAREYYDAIMEAGRVALDAYRGSAQYDMMISMYRWMTNPIVLIIFGIIEMVVKGGVLGLILAAFFKKNPDVFAAATSVAEENDNERQNG